MSPRLGPLVLTRPLSPVIQPNPLPSQISFIRAQEKNQQPTPGNIKNHATKWSQNRFQYASPMATASGLPPQEQGIEGTRAKVGPGSWDPAHPGGREGPAPFPAL